MALSTSSRPRSRPSAFSRSISQAKSDFKTDLGYFTAALTGSKYDDPNPERTASRRDAQAKRQEKMDKQFEGSGDSGLNSPNSEVRAAATARLKAEKLKAKGRATRKKFEKAKGKRVAKRRKLLLNIKEAST